MTTDTNPTRILFVTLDVSGKVIFVCLVSEPVKFFMVENDATPWRVIVAENGNYENHNHNVECAASPHVSWWMPTPGGWRTRSISNCNCTRRIENQRRRHACSMRRLIRSGSDLLRASANNCTNVLTSCDKRPPTSRAGTTDRALLLGCTNSGYVVSFALRACLNATPSLSAAPSAVGHHHKLQTPRCCPQQAARHQRVNRRETSVVVGIQDSQIHLSHEDVYGHALPLCTLQQLRFPTRNPFSPALLTVNKLHNGGQRRRLDGNTGKCASSRTKEGKGDVGEKPGKEEVPTVSNGTKGSWAFLRSQHGPSRWAEVKKDKRCAIVTFHATGSLVLPFCPLCTQLVMFWFSWLGAQPTWQHTPFLYNEAHTVQLLHCRMDCPQTKGLCNECNSATTCCRS